MLSYVIDLVSVTITETCRVGCSAVDVLSDDVLIYIFNLYRQDLESRSYSDSESWTSWSWHQWRALAHVCQRWRHIIFAWPNHLDIRIKCGSRTAAAEALDVWPALPISIRSTLKDGDLDGDDIIAALEHRERIAEVDLSDLSGPQLESCVALMQETFPILRILSLGCDAETTTLVIPDTFLVGRAPRLRSVHLCYVPFPTLPKLLLSASHLAELYLEEIPNTGYISPEAMATCLAVLTRLESVIISSPFWRSFPQNQTNQHPPPMTRAVLPSLTNFSFGGVSGEYVDDLMARIHLPRLTDLYLRFFPLPTFGVPKLPQIVHRIEAFKLPLEAVVKFYDNRTNIDFISTGRAGLGFEFQSTESDNQVSWLKGIYPQFLPLLSKIHYLELFDRGVQDVQDSTLWLEFLRPFSGVKTLYIRDQNSLKQIAHVLGELTDDRAADVLPMLDTIAPYSKTVWDEVKSWLVPLLQPFVDARQLLDHPVVVKSGPSRGPGYYI